MDKPTKPSENLPNSFGGTKENFSASKISTGYQKDVRDILGGANLNYWIDTQGKKFVYLDAICDFINALPIGKTIITDSNNKLVYTDTMPKATSDGNGNNIANTYEPKANVTSKGSASLPIYFDEYGVAHTITSYQGNSATATTAATATKATQDASGNVITSTYANQKLNNLHNDGNDFINQSKAMITGSVSDNALVYADILSRYRSSFDLSKFTVTGTPTISNGVASNFGLTNYISLGTVDFGSNFDFILKFKITSYTTARILSINNIQALMLHVDGDSHKIVVNIGDGSSFTVTGTGSTAIALNTDYLLKLSFNGSQYTLSLSTDGLNWTTDLTLTSSQVIPQGRLDLGVNRSLSAAVTGSFDLKSIEIKKSGVIVFSGKETGKDIIAADYNFVGSNVTVNNGIATNFSATSYLTGNKTLNLANPFPFHFHIKCHTPASWNSNYESLTGTTAFSIRNLSGVWNVDLGGLSLATTHTISLNTDYVLDLIHDGTNYSLYANGILIGSVTGTPTTANGIITYGYFGSVDTSRYWTGSIDLSDTYFIQNNKIVDAPLLFVDYVVTSGGAKIADVKYLDRIINAYEQGYKGYRYLTIDEDNAQFTLPQGMSVYEGMADCNLANITANAINDIFLYNQPADTYTTLTLGASGSTYTATDNGFFYLRAVGSSFRMYDATTGIGVEPSSTAASIYVTGVLPVRKGQEIKVDYTIMDASNVFRFFKARGV